MSDDDDNPFGLSKRTIGTPRQVPAMNRIVDYWREHEEPSTIGSQTWSDSPTTERGNVTACPICERGNVDADDCITIGEHIPGSAGPDGVFKFKAHRWCAFSVIQTGGHLAAYGPERMLPT
jgi:hypothetical protein